MSDVNSTARQIAEETNCSMATVNNKAKKLGIKVKGRSPEDHDRLIEALKSVKPRKRKGAAAPKKAAKAKKAAPVATASYDLNGFFNQGKAYIAEIRRRLATLDKEKAELEGQLEKLYALHPNMKK